MNKIKKLGLLSLCTFSILSVGVGALTHSEFNGRVKVSATNDQENYYLKDMVYVSDINNLDANYYINTYLLSRYSNDDYKLRYLSLNMSSGSVLTYQFGSDYKSFKLDYLERDTANYTFKLYVKNISGNIIYKAFPFGDTITNLRIGYSDNVVYDNLFDINNTSSMYPFISSGGLVISLPNYYYYEYGLNRSMNIKYRVDWNDDIYRTMVFTSDNIQIGNLVFENRKILEKGLVCFLLFDFDYRDLSSINDFLPYEIYIDFILQNEYDFLVNPKQDKVFYLSKWFLDLNILSAPTTTNGLINYVSGTHILKVNNIYYDYFNIKFYDMSYGFEPYDREYHKSFNLGFYNNDLSHSYVATTLFEYSYTQHSDFTKSNIISIWNNYTIEIVETYDTYYSLMGTFLLPFKSSVAANIGDATNGNTFIPNADLGGTMSLFGTAFNGVAGFLSIEILPNISLWILLLLPFFVTLLIFIVKLFKR